MKRIHSLFVCFMAFFAAHAQLSKSETESFIKDVNMTEVKEIYLIRTRHHDGSKGWFEKFEKFDPKTCNFTFNDKSLTLKGNSYIVLIPYDKIKLIFMNKSNFLTFEMVD